MNKGELVETPSGVQQFLFHCPGCGFLHGPTVKLGQEKGPLWNWNGSMDRPTFTPSLLVRWPVYKKGQEQPEQRVCHSFITDGRIQFLSDCTHELAGQTVEIPDWED